MRILMAMIVLAGIAGAVPARATDAEFCRGFEEGYRMIKGDMGMTPSCPWAPLTPFDSTDYREGLKAGIRAGQMAR